MTATMIALSFSTELGENRSSRAMPMTIMILYSDYSDYSDYSEFSDYSDYSDYSEFSDYSDYSDYSLKNSSAFAMSLWWSTSSTFENAHACSCKPSRNKARWKLRMRLSPRATHVRSVCRAFGVSP